MIQVSNGFIKSSNLFNRVMEDTVTLALNEAYTTTYRRLMSASVKGENKNGIYIPSLRYFAEESSKLSEVLISRYDSVFGRFGYNLEGISCSIKIIQAYLLEGICFVYREEEGTYDLFTLATQLFDSSNSYNTLKLDKVLAANLKGNIKACRVDLKNTRYEDTYDFKIVENPTKCSLDCDINTSFVPLVAILSLCDVLKELLSGNGVFQVKQLIDGREKARVVTLNNVVLGHYCDSADAVKYINASYVPLSAYAYLPCVGASSITSMVTRINLFDLYDVKALSSYDEISKCGVVKAKDALSVYIIKSAILQRLSVLCYTDLDAFLDVVLKFPEGERLDNLNIDKLTIKNISAYLNEVSDSSLKQIVSLMGIKEDIKTRLAMLNSDNKEGIFKAEDVFNLSSVLRKHLCRITYRKKDFTICNMLCTNNEEILKTFYGESYFALYESFSSKAWKVALAVKDLSDVETCKRELDYVGIHEISANDLLSTAKNLMESESLDLDDSIVVALYRVCMGKEPKGGSGSSSLISARTVDGYIVDKEPCNYLKSFILDNIVNVSIVY